MADEALNNQLTGFFAWYLGYANTSYSAYDDEIVAAVPEFAYQLANVALSDILRGDAVVSMAGQSVNISVSPETFSNYFSMQGIGDGSEVDFLAYLDENEIYSNEAIAALFEGVTLGDMVSAIGNGTATDVPSMIRALAAPEAIERVFGTERARRNGLIDAPDAPEVPPVEEAGEELPMDNRAGEDLHTLTDPVVDEPIVEGALPDVADVDAQTVIVPEGTHSYAPQQLIDWSSSPPRHMVGGQWQEVDGSFQDALNQASAAARSAGLRVQGREPSEGYNYNLIGWNESDVGEFGWRTSYDLRARTVMWNDPAQPFRNILASIAINPDADQRAALVIQAYRMVDAAGFPANDVGKQQFLQATQFIGSYIIEAGGDAAAVNQMNMYWNALDHVRSNGGSLIEAYAEVNGVTRAEAQTSLTHMSLVAGRRMLQDGMPMDSFNDILGNLMFDDQQVAMGAQTMLDILYGTHSHLATDQMRVDLEAILAMPPADFAVSYASYLDQVIVPFVGQNLDQFSEADLTAIFTDEQEALVQQIAAEARSSTTLPEGVDLTAVTDAGATIYHASNRHADYASAPAVYARTRSDGTVEAPVDNPLTAMVDEGAGFDNVTERFENLSEALPQIFLQFIENLFAGVLNNEEGRNTFLEHNFNGDQETMGQEIDTARTVIQASDAELYAATDAAVYSETAADTPDFTSRNQPVVPDTRTDVPDVVDASVEAPEVTMTAEAATSKLMELYSQTYTDVTSDDMSNLSNLFRFDTNENNQLDGNEGAYGGAGGLIFRLLDHVNGGKSWEETEQALQSLCPAYIPTIRQWLYGNDGEIDEEARIALEQLLASNADFANLYQIRCEHYGIQAVGLDSYQATGYDASVDQSAQLGG